MFVEKKLKNLIKIAYLSQEYQKLISYIDVIRKADCDTASKGDMLLELHVRLMAFLFASYSESEKFQKTAEIKFARNIRNIYTHNRSDKVVNFDFKVINDKYCEPYIALNADIDHECQNQQRGRKRQGECKDECKCKYSYYIKNTQQYNITPKDGFIVETACINEDYNNLVCINLFYFINTVYKQIQDFYSNPT